MEQDSKHEHSQESVSNTTHDNSDLLEQQDIIEEEKETLITQQRAKPQVSNVAQTRILNELKSLESSSIKYKYDPSTRTVIVLDKLSTITLDLSKSFPFDAPLISIELKEPALYYSMFNLDNVSFEDIMREHWHPSIKLVDIAEKSMLYINKNIAQVNEVPSLLARVSQIISNSKMPLMKLFQFLLAIKLLLIISLTAHSLIQNNTSVQISDKYIKIVDYTSNRFQEIFSNNRTTIESPLTVYNYILQGEMLKLFTLQGDLQQLNTAEHILVINLVIRLYSLMIEMVFVFIPLTLMINSLYAQYSKAFRINIIVLLFLNPYTMWLANVQCESHTLFIKGLISNQSYQNFLI